jgi:hypothetical protein
MKTILKIVTLITFLLLNVNHAKSIERPEPNLTTEYVTEPFPYFDYQSNWKVAINGITYLDLSQKGPVYYVKIGDTISLLKDPQGYITAAIRLGMDTIKVVPDKSGKYYRTVSLDLKQSDEDIKKAIEVKVSEIIVK